MSILQKKKTHAFSDIIRGVQHAISSAQDMLKAQQMQCMSSFFDDDGFPISKTIRLGNKDVEVPLMALVSHNQLAMDDVEIKFKSKIGNVEPRTFSSLLNSTVPINYAELQVEMDGIKVHSDDVMEVTIRFKMKETPEGISRLMDEYNKQI